MSIPLSSENSCKVFPKIYSLSFAPIIVISLNFLLIPQDRLKCVGDTWNRRQYQALLQNFHAAPKPAINYKPELRSH